MAEFFKHENQAWPPSLSSAGNICLGQKSDLLQFLEGNTLVHSPEVDVKILDGGRCSQHDVSWKIKNF